MVKNTSSILEQDIIISGPTTPVQFATLIKQKLQKQSKNSAPKPPAALKRTTRVILTSLAVSRLPPPPHTHIHLMLQGLNIFEK